MTGAPEKYVAKSLRKNTERNKQETMPSIRDAFASPILYQLSYEVKLVRKNSYYI